MDTSVRSSLFVRPEVSKDWARPVKAMPVASVSRQAGSRYYFDSCLRPSPLAQEPKMLKKMRFSAPVLVFRVRFHCAAKLGSDPKNHEAARPARPGKAH